MRKPRHWTLRSRLVLMVAVLTAVALLVTAGIALGGTNPKRPLSIPGSSPGMPHGAEAGQ